MKQGAVLEMPVVKQNLLQPKLKDIFVPCPICRGTLDIDIKGKVVCCSCRATWNVRGEPISNQKREEED